MTEHDMLGPIMFIFLQPISMETIIWPVNKVESYSFEILC
jgi:hypothetical protein